MIVLSATLTQMNFVASHTCTFCSLGINKNFTWLRFKKYYGNKQ
jgi:hypothetical protein